jgi:hypothetical protein
VPSFIEADDKYLIDPNSNWATFELYVEWNYLSEEKIAALNKVKKEYTREKASSIWQSSHSQELLQQYRQALEEQHKEQEEMEKKFAKSNDINIDGTEVTKHYDVEKQIGRFVNLEPEGGTMQRNTPH